MQSQLGEANVLEFPEEEEQLKEDEKEEGNITQFPQRAQNPQQELELELELAAKAKKSWYKKAKR